MRPITRRALLGAAPLLLPSLTPLAARAAWPDRSITWVVPFGPGGITDGASRITAQRMAQALGQQIVVENRPGAGGAIGTDTVLRAAPDGYTVLYGTSGTHGVQPVINPNARYDPIADFAPVHGLGASPNLLVVSPKSPWRSMADLVEHARRHPDTLTYGSSGVGTSLHLCGELLSVEAGLRMTHVPYVVGAQALTDVMAGRLDFLFDFPVTSLPHVREGRLRGLAVTDSVRVPLAPEIPTTAEAGFPGVTLTSWAGLFFPARTPPAVVARMAEATGEALRDPRVVEFYSGTATTLWPDMDTARFRAFLGEELPRLRALLQRAGAVRAG